MRRSSSVLVFRCDSHHAKKVAAFVPHLPLIIALRQKGSGEALQAISAKSGCSPTLDAPTVFDLKLEDNVRDSALKLNLNLNEDVVPHGSAHQKQSEVAGKEFRSKRIRCRRRAGNRHVADGPTRRRHSVLRGIDEYMALMDEHITTTQAMSFCLQAPEGLMRGTDAKYCIRNARRVDDRAGKTVRRA